MRLTHLPVVHIYASVTRVDIGSDNGLSKFLLFPLVLALHAMCKYVIANWLKPIKCKFSIVHRWICINFDEV